MFTVYKPNLLQKFLFYYNLKKKICFANKFMKIRLLILKYFHPIVPDLVSDAFTQRGAIEKASSLMNLAIKELADTKIEVQLCCCLFFFPLTSTKSPFWLVWGRTKICVITTFVALRKRPTN